MVVGKKPQKPKKYIKNIKNRKYKVEITYDKINFLPRFLSIVFTEDKLLFKKYNKIFFEIPYQNIISWADGETNWVLQWRIMGTDGLYQKEKQVLKYFKNNDKNFTYFYPLHYPPCILSNTITYYIERMIQKPEHSYHLYT